MVVIIGNLNGEIIIKKIFLLIALVSVGCVQKIRVNIDERCAVRYGSIKTRSAKDQFLIDQYNKKGDQGPWTSFKCDKPKSKHEDCLVFRHRIAGTEKERFNKWYDDNHTLRILLDSLILPWPFVEGYYKSKKNKAEKKARVAMYTACPDRDNPDGK